LAAQGLTNAEIGQRLYISPRTAQVHLTHVFAKLGITSRKQLPREGQPRD
jgi:DNA-binding CsgD family transcriptional regulator